MKGNKILNTGKGKATKPDNKKIPDSFIQMIPPNPMARFSIRVKPEKPNK